MAEAEKRPTLQPGLCLLCKRPLDDHQWRVGDRFVDTPICMPVAKR